MSHRLSGWVGVVVLALIAGGTACGSRDNLFVLDDEVSGHASEQGGVGVGGHAGSVGLGGSVGVGGSVGFAGHGGLIGVGGVGGGAHAGTVGFAGATAFGGSVGFAGTGNSIGGTAGFSCSACLAQNNGANPCWVAQCDFVNGACKIVPQNEGSSCFDGNLCAQSVCQAGNCVEFAVVACAQAPCMAQACDRNSGQCVTSPVTGPACDDGDPCTSNDQCVLGSCTRGTPVTSCLNNDKCCPAGCTAGNDNDCHPATQIVIQASNRGWYQAIGIHDPGNKNTFTGFSPQNQYNSFFSFDLSGVVGTIVSAQLVLELERFFGTDTTETASIWDVSQDAAALATTSQSTTNFMDLQSGAQYGQLSASPQAVGANMSASLNAQAVTDLNAARGLTFSVGVHIDTLSGQTQHDEGLRFSLDTEQRRDQLILTVQ